MNKHEIIQSTLNLVQIHGWDNLSVRMISKEIGFSTIKIYSDFGSKEKLLIEIQKDGFNKLKNNFQEVIKRANTPSEALERIALEHIKFSQKQPVYYELMFSFKFNKCNSDAMSVKQQSRDIIYNVIVEIGTEEPQLALHQFCAMIYGYVKLSNEMANAKKSFIDNSVRHFVKIFVKGIK